MASSSEDTGSSSGDTGSSSEDSGSSSEDTGRSEEHTSELQSLRHLVCRLLPPTSTLFPYTTLFRSGWLRQARIPVPQAVIPVPQARIAAPQARIPADRKSTRLNSSHLGISYAVFYPRHLHSFPTRRSSDLDGFVKRGYRFLKR